jgi:predicted Zn-dependent protease
VTCIAQALTLWLLTSGSAQGSGVEPVLALEQAGHDEAALQMAETLCAQPPYSPLPHLEAARLGLKLGRDGTFVQKHLEAARALAPDNPRVRYLSAEVREAGGNDAAARALYLEAVGLRAGYTEARTRLVALGIRTKDWTLAEAQLRAILAAPSGRTVGRRLQLARVLEDGGKLPEAEVLLLKLHHEDPASATVTLALSDFYTRHDKLKKALALQHETQPKKLRPLQPSRH